MAYLTCYRLLLSTQKPNSDNKKSRKSPHLALSMVVCKFQFSSHPDSNFALLHSNRLQGWFAFHET